MKVEWVLASGSLAPPFQAHRAVEQWWEMVEWLLKASLEDYAQGPR